MIIWTGEEVREGLNNKEPREIQVTFINGEILTMKKPATRFEMSANLETLQGLRKAKIIKSDTEGYSS